MTETETERDPTAKAEEAAHWHAIRSALEERIRRRWRALAQLSPEEFDRESVEASLTAATGPGDLLRLLDQVDRRLDTAFALQSRRSRAAPAPATPDPRAYK